MSRSSSARFRFRGERSPGTIGRSPDRLDLPGGGPYLRNAERVYDDLGRETSRTGGGQTISTTYYKDGSIDTTTGTDGRIWTFLYDPVGRTTSLTRQGTPASYATSYAYNNAGQLASETADGRLTSYTYATSNDAAAGRYKGLLQSQVDAVTGGTTAYTYDTAGRVATRVDPAGMTWTRTYETATGRIDTQTIRKTISGSPRILAYFDLDYDETGNVTTRDEKIWHAGAAPVGTNPETATSPNGTGTWTYAYDGASRMLSATGPKAPPATGTGTWTYTYDGQGNRLTETAPGASTITTTTDAQGWPVATDNGTPANAADDTALTYDTAGNLAKIQAPASQLTTTFTYDAWARTKRTVTTGSASSDITYAIDAFGRTSSRGPTGGASSTTTNYRYAGAGETLVTETTGSQTITYSHTPGGPLAQKVGSTAEVFIRDLHGDVVGRLGLAASTHDMSSATWFSPWGVPSATPLEGSAARLGYQGQITETSTGAVDMTTRQYLPALGRFTTRDVLFGQPRDPLTLNQYGYGEANPITYDDPLGMSVHAVIGSGSRRDGDDDCTGAECAGNSDVDDGPCLECEEPPPSHGPDKSLDPFEQVDPWTGAGLEQTPYYLRCMQENTGGHDYCLRLAEMEYRDWEMLQTCLSSGRSVDACTSPTELPVEGTCEVAATLSFIPDGRLDILNFANWATQVPIYYGGQMEKVMGLRRPLLSYKNLGRATKWIGGGATAVHLACMASGRG